MPSLLPVAPGTGHFGRSAGIARGVTLADNSVTQSVRGFRRTADVRLDKTNTAEQFLEKQVESDTNSPQAVQARMLTDQSFNAKFRA